MNSPQSVVVLDVGSSKVACVCAKLDERHGFMVQALEVEPCNVLTKGVVSNTDLASDAIRAVLDKLTAKIQIDTEELIVSISGSHVEGMNVQGLKPIIPRGRAIAYQDVLEVINHSRAIVLASDREQLQALPRSFKVDATSGVHKPIGMTAGKLEVTTYLVTGAISAVQALNTAITDAGYHIEQLVFAPLAAGVGVLTQDEMELGAAVVDIGHSSTNVGVFSGGSIAYGVTLPIGSRNITGDIQQLLKTSVEEADKLKMTSASAYAKSVDPEETVDVMQVGQMQSRPLQKRVLAEIVEARVREIAIMVKRHVEKSGLYANLPGGLILTGGGSLLAGIDKAMEVQLGHLRIRVAEPQLPPRINPYPGSAVAVGLASFALQCYDELGPASGVSVWKDRVKSLFSMINSR